MNEDYKDELYGLQEFTHIDYTGSNPSFDEFDSEEAKVLKKYVIVHRSRLSFLGLFRYRTKKIQFYTLLEQLEQL